MSAAALESIAWKVLAAAAARLSSPRRNPFPLSAVRGQLEAMLHSRQAAVFLCALALFVLVYGVRSAWWDIYGRWYGR